MPTSVRRTTKRSTKITAKAGRSMAQSAGKRLYFNRELSWLAFNQRVLDQARSEANPLLERVKFLAILSSNLDEFYEIRVAGLMQQQDSQGGEASLDGLSPREQLKQIRTGVNSLIAQQYKCWREHLVPALAKEKIVFLTASQLDARQRGAAAHLQGCSGARCALTLHRINGRAGSAVPEESAEGSPTSGTCVWGKTAGSHMLIARRT